MTPPSDKPNYPRRPTRPRIQSPTERDLASEQARRERASSVDDAVVEASDDVEDLTGQYEGEELERLRRERRDTKQRLTHVENKLDRTVHALGEFKAEIKAEVAGMRGEMIGLTGEIRRTLDALNEREHVRFTTTVDVDATKQKAAIESQAETEAAKAIADARAQAQIEVAKAKAKAEAEAQVEVAKAKAELAHIENRRKTLLKVIGGAGLLVLGVLVHVLAQKFGWSP